MQTGMEALSSALRDALSADKSKREQAEHAIRISASCPNHCLQLLAISTSGCSISTSSDHLLAATLLKNELKQGNFTLNGEYGLQLRALFLQYFMAPPSNKQLGTQLATAASIIMHWELQHHIEDRNATLVNTVALQLEGGFADNCKEHAILALTYTLKRQELDELQRPASQQLARFLLTFCVSAWSIALDAVRYEGGPDQLAFLRLSVAFTKLVRQIFRALGQAGCDAACVEKCISVAADLASNMQGALADPSTLHELERLGSSLGKLLCLVSGWTAPSCRFLMERATTVLFLEAEMRHNLLNSIISTRSDGSETWKALKAREAQRSAFPLQCTKLLIDQIGRDAQLDAQGEIAGQSALLASLDDQCMQRIVWTLLVLLQRTHAQIGEWRADPESFCCRELLPPLEEALSQDDEYAAGDAEAELWMEGDDADREEGDEPHSSTHRLQNAAELALAGLLESFPDAAGAALLKLLPSEPCAPGESLGSLLFRDACYSALGICACELQSMFSFQQILLTAQKDLHALNGQTNPALLAIMQVRLCWLLSCWWAFGSSGDAAEDERACAQTYSLLSQLLSAGADISVRLQAAQSLHTVLRTLDENGLRDFAPFAADTCTAILQVLPHCHDDEAALWLLLALICVLRVPEAHPVAQSHSAAFNLLWQQAVQDQRTLLVQQLKRIGRMLNVDA